MMRDLVIYGSGGHAREIAQLVDDINDVAPAWSLLGFLDDVESTHGESRGSYAVLGGSEWWRQHSGVHVIIAIGSTAARQRVASELRGATFATLVHPRAAIGARVSLGRGTMVSAGVVVTCDVRLGEHVILNVNSSVAHDSVIEDFVTLAPRVSLAGATRVRTGADLGIGCVSVPKVTIGAWSIVGAGAVVTRPVPDNTTAVGVPARIVKTREPGWQL